MRENSQTGALSKSDKGTSETNTKGKTSTKDEESTEHRERRDVRDVRDQFGASYSLLDDKLKFLGGICSLALFLVECIVILIYIATGKFPLWSDLSKYIIDNVVRLFALIGGCEAVIIAIKKLCERDKDGKLTEKGIIQTQILNVTMVGIVVCAVPFVHVTVPATYLAPMAAVFISVVYADKVVLKWSTGIIITAVVTGSISNYFKVDELPEKYIINCFVTVVCVGLSYMISRQLLTVEENKEVEKLNADLEIETVKKKSTLDTLTGLKNVGELRKQLHMNNKSLTVAMIDIDDFKTVNDSYGHPFGNIVLQRLANIMRRVESDTIHAYRFGGEEFSFVFNGKQSDEEVRNILNNVRQEFMDQRYRGMGSLTITISTGFASKESTGISDCDKVLERADDALYMAKKTVKNRVVNGTIEELEETFKQFEEYVYELDETDKEKKSSKEKLKLAETVLEKVMKGQSESAETRGNISKDLI